jgi:hypothetical protein
VDHGDLIVDGAAGEEVASTPRRMRLTPRHRGWTVSSLMLVSIAVTVSEEDKNGTERVVATCMAARCARTRG